jgi:hydrogenase maturation protease
MAAGDDAVGLAVIERLRGDPAAAGLQLESVATPHDLVDRLPGPGPVVIVDAVLADRPAGTLLIGTPEAFEASGSAAWSSHGFGAMQAVGLARALDPGGLPAEIHVVGVVIDPPAEYRDGLSETVARAVEEAAGAILRLAGGQ